MTVRGAHEKINIRPGVSILAVLPHLPYSPWFALAEFVDNSLQSYLDNIKALKALHGSSFRLEIDIDIDPSDDGLISVRDNAAGIHKKDYERAFRAAELPADRSGLCEFGMGMKSAACWFAPVWSVRTCALGEGLQRTVRFDIAKIVHDQIEELDVKISKVSVDQHFTEIILSSPYQVPVKKTLGKIKEHLASIYRVFIRDGKMLLRVNGEELSWTMPKFLTAPYYKDKTSKPITWRKDLEFDFGHGRKIKGFAGLMEKMKLAKAGFSLFRRGRLVQGSGDEGYRPGFIFGGQNSHRFQRLYGEFHLQGFDVTHTKDGIKWHGDEEADFLEALKQKLDEAPMPIIKQGEEYRKKDDPETIAEEAGKIPSGRERLPSNRPEVLPPAKSNAGGKAGPTDVDRHPQAGLKKPSTVPRASLREFQVDIEGQEWLIVMELSMNPAIGEWLTSVETVNTTAGSSKPHQREIQMTLALSHPFMIRFGGPDLENLEPLVRVAAALGLAEVVARESGAKKAGTIRRVFNELLKESFYKP